MLSRTVEIEPYIRVPELALLLDRCRSRAHELLTEGRLPKEQDPVTGEWRVPLRALVEQALLARPGVSTGRRPATPMSPSELARLPRRLRVPQVAAALGVTTARVGQLLRRGQLAGEQAKGQWRVLRRDVEAFIAKREAKG